MNNLPTVKCYPISDDWRIVKAGSFPWVFHHLHRGGEWRGPYGGPNGKCGACNEKISENLRRIGGDLANLLGWGDEWKTSHPSSSPRKK